MSDTLQSMDGAGEEARTRRFVACRMCHGTARVEIQGWEVECPSCRGTGTNNKRAANKTSKVLGRKWLP